MVHSQHPNSEIRFIKSQFRSPLLVMNIVVVLNQKASTKLKSSGNSDQDYCKATALLEVLASGTEILLIYGLGR